LKTIIHDLYGLKTAILAFFTFLFSQLEVKTLKVVTNDQENNQNDKEEEMGKVSTVPKEVIENQENNQNDKEEEMDKSATPQETSMVKLTLTQIYQLVKAVKEGDLDKRADLDQLEGDYREIVRTVNDMLESISIPLRDIGGMLDRLAAGDSKAQVTADYKGDYNVLKVAVNELGNQINLLGQETGKLAEAAGEGNLDYRGDNTKFKGDIAEIINGVNRTMEGIVTPLRDIGGVLDRLANKDLTARVTMDYKGDYAVLKESVNSLAEATDDALTQVTDAVEQVSSASGQISSGSQSLAEGANEQASSLEEISSSLEEMSSMTKQNADNANQAKVLSGSARESADKGNDAMTRMSEAIDKIKTSSDQTAKIVKTIDEIAFQTNLLALNAAVEAARAGEAGKGFAVVAEEVRNLAQRSAEAAKNTADMIEESVKNAEGGVQITEEVAKSLEEIAEGSGKVNDLVAEIAAAAAEQSQGIEQVNTAVAQLDKVTQQNASNSEESASAAEELNSQAEELQNMVSEFKLSNVRDRKTRIAAPKTAGQHLHSEAPAAAKGLKDRVHAMVAHDKKSIKKTASSKSKEGEGNGGKKFKPDAVIPLDDVDFKDF